MIRIITLLILTAYAITAFPFSWDGATVYFLITDRFCNGDTTNDINYGRKIDYGSERLNAATFHGGDLKGVLQKVQEGYFTQLGIDVVWLTDVYEQIHGWMTGSGSVNDFPHYGYHGYYPLDYTQIDKNYGTIDEFRTLVDTLHSQGIRVMLGANLNDPGYPTQLDAIQLGFADTGLTEKEAAEHIADWSYDSFFDSRLGWNGWYNRDWIRMPNENWDDSNPLEATLYGMPDFKDENDSPVKIPDFLKRKWIKEGKDNNPWINPSALKLRKDREWSPLQYVIAWISSWVEEFGIDGVRCDIVEYVNTDRWRQLSDACNIALKKWRNSHPESPASQWTDKFYMTGDYENADIDYKPDYAEAGFSSMVNFFFPKHGDLDGITCIWQAYSDSIDSHPGWHPFSYLNNSYHRDADMDNMHDCATTLLLAPGAVQLFYGDETRRGLSDARLNVDSDQAFRSDMNWDNIDEKLLEHFRKLGTIRRDNPVIATGRQRTIDVHTCVRENATDSIVIRLFPENGAPIVVKDIFPEGSIVKDLYSDKEGIIINGTARFPQGLSNVAIIKKESGFTPYICRQVAR